MEMAVLYRTNWGSQDEEAGREGEICKNGKKWRGALTDTATVKHQISRLAVAETPENRDGAERSSSSNDVANSWCPFGKHMVISSCDP
jgi:hypothetical protein